MQRHLLMETQIFTRGDIGQNEKGDASSCKSFDTIPLINRRRRLLAHKKRINYNANIDI